MAGESAPALTVFAPNPLLTVTIECEGEGVDAQESIHIHAGGQGVWVAAMARELGAAPALIGLAGGETGAMLRAMLAREGEEQLVACAAASGCCVTDRRSGRREPIAVTFAQPPSRHELDELLSRTVAHALGSGWLVVTNPYPGETLPLDVYGELVANARQSGVRTLVDLSSPRLESALTGAPDLVKLNDWELAEHVQGPVDTGARLLAAARGLQELGAGAVVVTRGERPSLVARGEDSWLLRAPRFDHGFREGCGDAMMGALSAAWASGETFERALVLGAAAGAANFLRRGIGRASRAVVEELAAAVTLRAWRAGEAL